MYHNRFFFMGTRLYSLKKYMK